MSSTVVIHQPDFIPYIGFFHRFLYSDLFIVLDHVQFVDGTSRAWTHRDRIKTEVGPQWLSLSITKTSSRMPINEIALSERVDWRSQHLRVIERCYKKAPFYDEIFPHVSYLYSGTSTMMAEFNLESIKLLMSLFDVQRPMILSSSLRPKGSRSDLLVDLLLKVGADRYLSGQGARGYMEASRFHTAGIDVVWQQFIHPTYPQLFPPFEPYLSAIDLLFNCGIEESRRILRTA
jgi:hypothetical protein